MHTLTFDRHRQKTRQCPGIVHVSCCIMNCPQLLQDNMVLHDIYMVPSHILFDFPFMCILGAPSFHIPSRILRSRISALFGRNAHKIFILIGSLYLACPERLHKTHRLPCRHLVAYGNTRYDVESLNYGVKHTMTRYRAFAVLLKEEMS